MGIIQRQGIKQTVVNYAAAGIGALSILFVYPLEEARYGLFLFLYSTANFFVPFASLGLGAVAIRYFPSFRDASSGHRGFLGFLLSLALVFFCLFALLVLLFKGALLNALQGLQFPNAQLIDTYLPAILLFTFMLLLYGLLANYTSNFHRIVVPGIFKNLWPKIALPVLILLSWAGFLSLQAYIAGLLIMQALIVVGMFWYLGYLGELRLSRPRQIWRSGKLREMGHYGLYGMLGQVGSIFAFQLDHIMISTLTNLSNTGIYGIAQFIGNAIEMPTRSIYAIASPIIAKAWEADNLKEIAHIYKRSSINLLIFGLFVFALLLLNLDDLFRLTAKYETLKAASWVVVFIGLGKLVDMAFSVNGQIIAFSRFYRFNLYAVLGLGVINVVLNYLFIPRLGIQGAALASFIAITSFNLLRAAFLWWRLRLHPFSGHTLVLIGLAGLAGGLVYWIPFTGHPLLNIALRSGLLALLFFPPVLYLRLSPEVNQLLLNWWKKRKSD